MDSIASIHHVPASWLRNSDLAPFIPAYWRGLIAQRYADNTVRVYLCGVAHFARWTHQRRLAVADLGDDDIQRFLDGHLPTCNCPQPVQRSRHQLRAALRHLLASLEHAGILTGRQAPDAVEDELRRFDAHMLNARGLAQNTRIGRVRILRPFLQQFCRSKVDELTEPTPPRVCVNSSSSNFNDGVQPAPVAWPMHCAATCVSGRFAEIKWATCCQLLRHLRIGA